MKENERRLLASWEVNAGAWAESVRAGAIESRRVATDAAVVEAVVALRPRCVLDVGCGEGWLVRALARHGVEAVGVDGSTPLVEEARALGGETYHAMSYEALAADASPLGGPFDAVVCNFALLGEHLGPLLAALHDLLELEGPEGPEGTLVVQTVHPWAACGAAPYADGWREETFDGFSEGYQAVMPWYFRTLGSWLRVLGAASFAVTGVREPVHPQTRRPLSLLLIARPQPGDPR